MNYQECAKELLESMIKNQRTRCHIQRNISELAKGELAVLVYLMEQDGVNAYQISHYFDINTSRVAAILNSLSKKQYVERRTDAQDKRKIQVFITASGKTYVKKRQADILSHIAKILEALGEEDALDYIRITKRVADLMNNDLC